MSRFQPVASGAWRLVDTRQKGKVEHRFEALLRQRVFALALGYEDVNDDADLRHDLALQTAAERDRVLASPSPLSRFENAAGRDWAWAIHEALVEDFIASHPEGPRGTDPRLRRHRRCRARPPGGAFLPRLLRPLLLPAALQCSAPGGCW